MLSFPKEGGEGRGWASLLAALGGAAELALVLPALGGCRLTDGPLFPSRAFPVQRFLKRRHCDNI